MFYQINEFLCLAMSGSGEQYEMVDVPLCVRRCKSEPVTILALVSQWQREQFDKANKQTSQITH